MEKLGRTNMQIFEHMREFDHFRQIQYLTEVFW